MGRVDCYSSLFWVIASILICFHSLLLGVGTLSEPGSGFIFFCSGLVVGVFSLLIFILSVKGRKGEVASPFRNVHWGKLALALGYILLFGVFLERLGFLISTFLLTGLLLRTIESKRWYVIVLVALTGAFGTYSIFELWLQTRLPKGFLGF